MDKKMFMFYQDMSAFYHVPSYNPYILENNTCFFLLIQKTSLSLQ